MSSGAVHWTPGAGSPFLGDAEVTRALQAALDHGGQPERVVDVVFVDDEALARMHGEFLADPSPTDVITFDLGETDGGPLLPPEARGPDGELYVSVDRARAVAADRGQPVERELVLYVVHGALHLVGFDDRDEGDRQAMRGAERAVMESLGFASDDAPHDA